MGDSIGKPGSHKREAFEAAERQRNARRYWANKLKPAPTAQSPVPPQPKEAR